MLSICHDHSLQWKYEYQAFKSAVIVFNETEKAKESSGRTWLLGNDEIAETECKHLGVMYSCPLTELSKARPINLKRHISEFH